MFEMYVYDPETIVPRDPWNAGPPSLDASFVNALRPGMEVKGELAAADLDPAGSCWRRDPHPSPPAPGHPAPALVVLAVSARPWQNVGRRQRGAADARRCTAEERRDRW